VTHVHELIGGASGLGWVAVKAVLLFTVAVIGLRLGERRTLAQLSAFDFAVAVAIGAIIGRGATASDTSFATSAVALVTLLVAHRVVAIARLHSRVIRLIDHPPRVLVARGQLQRKELARAGLTDADVYALLRENGVGDLSQVGYLLYETRGTVTVIGADREPGPLMRDALNASGYRLAPQERRAQQLWTLNTRRTSQAVPTPTPAGDADGDQDWAVMANDCCSVDNDAKRSGKSAGGRLGLGDAGRFDGVLGYEHRVVRQDREPVVHSFGIGGVPPVAEEPCPVGEGQPTFDLVDFDREGHCLCGGCLDGR
jgi:uncharacterized membrane protein YcaP (DUF421 family)